MNLITKAILFILVLMLPIIVIYTFSQQESSNVVGEQVDLVNKNRLSYYLNQLDSTVDQASFFSIILMNDPDMIYFATRYPADSGYDRYVVLKTIEEKLGLFSGAVANKWNSRITIYFPPSRTVVSSYSPVVKYDEHEIGKRLANGWTYQKISVNGAEKGSLTRIFLKPNTSLHEAFSSPYLIEINLFLENISALLDTFKTEGINDPFYYHSPEQYVLNSSSNRNVTKEIMSRLDNATPVNEPVVQEVEGKKYRVYMMASTRMDWTLIDYIPLAEIIEPLTTSRNLFYSTVAILMLVGIFAALLLYFHIQVPVRLLTNGVQQFKSGKYSTRLPIETNSDFRLLFQSFNGMASEIQRLIEKVYVAEIRSREAMMKQLQSQINPHFLYNCFAFIVSMAKLKKTETVVEMGHSLADYYKYVTHNEQLVTSVREEIAFVVIYLDIMNLQLTKFVYDIQLQPSMNELIIPRLLIQPIVENAIVHGLEPKLGEGTILITGIGLHDKYIITVEDDGVGLDEEGIAWLNDSVIQPEKQGTSTGMWNVQQRLSHYFGEGSRLQIGASSLGGLKVQLSWTQRSGQIKEKEGESGCIRY
ncbi:sensor histidine kinase [Paenibacillus sepulcri]|uniref:Histidine kinase n=1 Tax=Paenibacillus sepulcri TaxID=359917 RepID=A0ABS7BYH3_9BACL|nr:histidine kinase [Paenibacillus sepulcri]